MSPGIQRASPPSRGPLTKEQEWFKDLKFGMFIHWGVESLIATHPESASPHAPWSEPGFDARSLGAELERLGEHFDPAAWVSLAERAGQRYICCTAKHHLGFANYASRHSDYTAVAMGPHRDFLRPLADECHRGNMPLFAYLSLSDMHHPDFRPLDAAALQGHPEGVPSGSPERAAWQRYEAYLFAQLEELATGYAPLAGFWLDPGPWNGPSYRYPMGRIEEMVHSRFPRMLVGGRDWDGAEKTYDSRVSLGDTGLVLSYDLFPQGKGPQPDAWPFEVCDTMNDSWFYSPVEQNHKDVATLIRRLVEVAGRGGNYLLNQSPLPSGALNPEDARRLDAVGEWLRRNGEALYGTRPLGTPSEPWGWPLAKRDAVYLHILRWPGKRLTIPWAGMQVTAARWLDGEPLRFEASPEGIALHLSAAPHDEVDSIAVLSLNEGSQSEGVAPR